MEKLMGMHSPSKGSQQVKNILYRRVNESSKRSACQIVPEARLCPEKVASQPYSPLRMRQNPEDPIAPPTQDPAHPSVAIPRQATPGQGGVLALHAGSTRADGCCNSTSAVKKRHKAVVLSGADGKSRATTATRAQAQFPGSAKSTRPQPAQLKARIHVTKPSPAAVPEKPNRRRAQVKVV